MEFHSVALASSSCHCIPYSDMWGENHVGFVRMAVRHGYTIVPVATVGTEDVVRPVMDVPIREVLTAGGILKPPESSSKAFEDGARFPVVLPRPGDVSWHFCGKHLGHQECKSKWKSKCFILLTTVIYKLTLWFSCWRFPKSQTTHDPGCFSILLLDHWWYDWRLPGVHCFLPIDHCGHWGSKGPGLKMIQMCVSDLPCYPNMVHHKCTWDVCILWHSSLFHGDCCRCISVSCRCFARHTLKARRRIWFSFGNYEMWRSSACRPAKLEPAKSKALNSRHWKRESPMLLVSKCWSLTRKALIGYWHTESLIHSALSSVPTVSGPLLFWMCWVRSPL